MLLKAWHKIYGRLGAGEGGREAGRQREEGRECAARTPCCAQVRYCRGCASAPGSGGRRTRRGVIGWPLE